MHSCQLGCHKQAFLSKVLGIFLNCRRQPRVVCWNLSILWTYMLVFLSRQPFVIDCLFIVSMIFIVIVRSFFWSFMWSCICFVEQKSTDLHIALHAGCWSAIDKNWWVIVFFCAVILSAILTAELVIIEFLGIMNYFQKFSCLVILFHITI